MTLTKSKWEKTFLGRCDICLEELCCCLPGGREAVWWLPGRSVFAVNPGGMKQVAVDVGFMYR